MSPLINQEIARHHRRQIQATADREWLARRSGGSLLGIHGARKPATVMLQRAAERLQTASDWVTLTRLKVSVSQS
jgi:hypothetical protein